MRLPGANGQGTRVDELQKKVTVQHQFRTLIRGIATVGPFAPGYAGIPAGETQDG